MEAVKEFLTELESADSLVSSWSDIPRPKEATTLCDVLDGLIRGANSSGNTEDESGTQYGHGIIEASTYRPWIKNWANIRNTNLAKEIILKFSQVISLVKQQASGSDNSSSHPTLVRSSIQSLPKRGNPGRLMFWRGSRKPWRNVSSKPWTHGA